MTRAASVKILSFSNSLPAVSVTAVATCWQSTLARSLSSSSATEVRDTLIFMTPWLSRVIKKEWSDVRTFEENSSRLHPKSIEGEVLEKQLESQSTTDSIESSCLLNSSGEATALKPLLQKFSWRRKLSQQNPRRRRKKKIDTYPQIRYLLIVDWVQIQASHCLVVGKHMKERQKKEYDPLDRLLSSSFLHSIHVAQNEVPQEHPNQRCKRFLRPFLPSDICAVLSLLREVIR